jgi:hypothetical protein
MPGDTRITILYVAELGKENEIPKRLLKKELEKEAPHFMRTLMDLEIPPSPTRLHIPVISTRDKENIEHQSMSALLRFIKENTHEIPGAMILFSDFYRKFQSILPEEEKGYWTQRQVSLKLPFKTPTGKYGSNSDVHVANLSWSENPEIHAKEAVELVVINGRLKPKT